MSNANISVHAEQQHACGHMHETVFHMKEAKLEGHAETHHPTLWTARDAKEFKAHTEIEQEHTLELSGDVERIEFTMCRHDGWLKRLWKRFTTWLHYLRHPCTIITMDEAPAKGVNIHFSYGGEYEEVKVIADTLIERWETGKSLTDGTLEEAAKKVANKRLEEVAYALYLSDYEATHPSLGRPPESWEELSQDEREMYLRHVNAVLKKQEQLYGATVRRTI